jgi:hypothetical protein
LFGIYLQRHCVRFKKSSRVSDKRARERERTIKGKKKERQDKKTAKHEVQGSPRDDGDSTAQGFDIRDERERGQNGS